MLRWMCVTTSSTVWLACRGTSYVRNSPASAPRHTRTVSVRATGGRREASGLSTPLILLAPHALRLTKSGAFVQTRHHELAMAERLGRGQAPVARAQHDFDQLVAGLVEVLLALQKTGAIVVEMFRHRARRARVRRQLDDGDDGVADHVALTG